MKLISTILVSFSIVSAIMVSLTASEQLGSLSAYALADNVLWYRLMHLSAVMYFMLNIDKNRFNLFIGIGMGLILAFDMYQFQTLHNIITASTLALAAYSLIKVVRGFERSQMIFLGVAAVGVFCVGYFTNFRHLTAEIIAMATIMNGKLIETWK